MFGVHPKNRNDRYREVLSLIIFHGFNGRLLAFDFLLVGDLTISQTSRSFTFSRNVWTDNPRSPTK